VDSDRYTIDAKAAGPQAMEMMRGPMLQALLEERFHLKVRRETREVPVYALTVAKGTPKLQPTRPGSCQAIDITHPEEIRRPCGGFRPSILEKSPKVDRETASHSVGVDTIGQTIGGLCRQLSVALDRDVVDRTGIPACSISTWN
jgi:uncharacterized protein (TIGR03435 family)